MSRTTEAIARERAAYRAVIRWRALYARCRARMNKMDRHSAEALHYRLKDAEYAAIAEHEAAERELAETAKAEGVVLLTASLREQLENDRTARESVARLALAMRVVFTPTQRTFLHNAMFLDPEEWPAYVARLAKPETAFAAYALERLAEAIKADAA